MNASNDAVRLPRGTKGSSWSRTKCPEVFVTGKTDVNPNSFGIRRLQQLQSSLGVDETFL